MEFTNLKSIYQFADVIENNSFSERAIKNEHKSAEEDLGTKPVKLNRKGRKKLLLKYLNYSKKFFIDKDIVFLLEKTDNKIYRRKTPFSTMYIDLSNFRLPFIKGCLIQTCAKLVIINGKSKEKIVRTDLYFTRAHPQRDENGLYTNKIRDEWMIEYEELFSNKDLKSDVGQLRLFICNFLDFLNNPEVEIVKVDRTIEQNIKRVNRGRLPIPKLNDVKITGKLKIYLNELISGGKFHYSHRFWVRGHFRTLRSERYGDKIGTKIWILPYVKGEGILIDKMYKTKKTVGGNTLPSAGANALA